MPNMNVTMMTKKSAPGQGANVLTKVRCPKCKMAWWEPTQASTCTCPKKAPKKTDETATE